MASPSIPSNPKTSGNDGSPSSGPKFSYSSTELARLREPWKNCLIVKVLGRRLRLQHCRDHLLRIWSVEGDLDIIELGCEFFLLKFSEFEDYEKVRKGVPWLIYGYYIAIRPWSPNFKPSEAIITHTRVWARLPELPIEYYDKEVLFEMGGAIGRTIKIDPVTERQEKCRFARICVEVDMRRPLVTQIDLDGLTQEVKYEGHVGQLQLDQAPHSLNLPGRALSNSRANMLAQVNPTFPTVGALRPSQGTGTTTLVSISPPCTYLSAESNNSVGRKQNFQSVLAENVPLAMGKLPSPMDTPIDHLPLSLEPETSKLSAKSAKLQPQNHQAHPLPPSPAGFSSNTIASPACNIPRPTHGLMVFPMQKASCFATPSTSEASPNLDCVVASPVSKKLRPTQDLGASPPQLASCLPTSSTTAPSAAKEARLASCLPTSSTTAPSAAKEAASPVPSPFPNFNFRSLEIKDFSEPEQAEKRTGQDSELNLENHQNDFNIQGAPWLFRTEPNTPNFGITVNFSRDAYQHKIRFTRLATSSTMHHTRTTIPASFPKKLLVWNNAVTPIIKPAMKDLIQMHKPSIILLIVPRILAADANQFIEDIGLLGSHLLVHNDLGQGMMILWKEEDVHIEVSSSTSAQVHLAVEVISNAQNWPLYGDTCAQSWEAGACYFYNPNQPYYSSSSDSEFALSENEARHRIPAPLVELLYSRQKMGATM